MRKTLLITILLVAMSTLGACTQRQTESSAATPPAEQSVSTAEESEGPESASTSDSQQEQEESESADSPAGEGDSSAGTGRFSVSLTDGSSVDITLDIPEGWSTDAETIYDENERHIGSLWTIIDTPQTYVPADAGNPFAEADETIGSILNTPGFETRDFAVNELPARAYYYGTGEDGPDFLTDTHYSYFIFVNGEVLRVSFHTRVNDTIYTQADFDGIIESFAVAS